MYPLTSSSCHLVVLGVLNLEVGTQQREREKTEGAPKGHNVWRNWLDVIWLVNLFWESKGSRWDSNVEMKLNLNEVYSKNENTSLDNIYLVKNNKSKKFLYSPWNRDATEAVDESLTRGQWCLNDLLNRLINGKIASNGKASKQRFFPLSHLLVSSCCCLTRAPEENPSAHRWWSERERCGARRMLRS